jgi:hypothetical protein
MAKKKNIEVVDTQKDGDIVIETIVEQEEKKLVPVCDARGMILYWTEE